MNDCKEYTVIYTVAYSLGSNVNTYTNIAHITLQENEDLDSALKRENISNVNYIFKGYHTSV